METKTPQKNLSRRKEKDILSKLTAFVVELQKDTLEKRYLGNRQISLISVFGIQRESLLSIGLSGNIQDLSTIFEEQLSFCNLHRKRTGVAQISRTRFLEEMQHSLESLIQLKKRHSCTAHRHT